MSRRSSGESSNGSSCSGSISNSMLTYSSSSEKRNALKASAYSTPASSPTVRARSRTHGAAASPSSETCWASAAIFVSIVSVMST